jgi:hypothetical protein
MPKILKLPPLDLGYETIGRRFARVRKERGVTAPAPRILRTGDPASEGR